MINAIRFILTPIAAILGYVIALMLCAGLISLTEYAFNSDNHEKSPDTAASAGIIRLIFLFFAVIAPILIISLASITAPTHKKAVRHIIFTIGSIFAIILAVGTTLYIEGIIAISCGIITLVVYPNRHHGRLHPNQSLE